MKPQYDIFISYRRVGFDTANLIATTLKSKGYRVFFDVESLRSGKFNEQLFSVIDECRDFLVVLPSGALDRCIDEDDWVRKEVCHAMASGKNIIPVMLSGFVWPQPMPSGMEELKNYQAVTASSREYFDLAMERLCIYLKSKPMKRFHRVSKLVGVIVGGVAFVFAVLVVSLFFLSVPVCSEYANDMTEHLARLDEVSALNDDLLDGWEKYKDKIGKAKTDKFRKEAQNDYLDDLQALRMQLHEITPEDTTMLEISGFRTLLLFLRGIDAMELSVEPAFANSFFTELGENIRKVESNVIAEDLSNLSSSFVKMDHDIIYHTLNGLYYSYLELFSLMPNKSVRHLREMEHMFKCFPTYANLKLTTEEYLAKQNDAIAAAQRLEDRLAGAIERDQSEFDELESRLCDLEKKANDELSQKYSSALEACRLNPGDDLALQWTKITNLASFMVILLENQDPEIGEMSVTPQIVYGDLSKLMDSFIEMNPSQRQWAESSRAFYKEVCNKKRPLAGTVLFSVNDGTHPVLQVGDIIVSMKGTAVSNYQELFAAYAKEGPATTVFLRLENGKLVEHEAGDCGSLSSILFANL